MAIARATLSTLLCSLPFRLVPFASCHFDLPFVTWRPRCNDDDGAGQKRNERGGQCRLTIQFLVFCMAVCCTAVFRIAVCCIAVFRMAVFCMAVYNRRQLIRRVFVPRRSNILMFIIIGRRSEVLYLCACLHRRQTRRFAFLSAFYRLLRPANLQTCFANAWNIVYSLSKAECVRARRAAQRMPETWQCPDVCKPRRVQSLDVCNAQTCARVLAFSSSRCIARSTSSGNSLGC